MSQTNDFTKLIQMGVCRLFPGSRVFRQNVGLFYGYYAVRDAKAALKENDPKGAAQILAKAQPIECGQLGQPDLGGWLAVKLPNGATIPVPLSIEIKTAADKLSPGQKAYGKIYSDAGCIWVCARSEEVCYRELRAKADAIVARLMVRA